MKISTIINFCTNDQRFIGANIENTLKFSDEVMIVYASHFLDGSPEDISLIDKIKGKYKNCIFLQLPWRPEYKPRFWHNMFRYYAAGFAKNDWILFLDADEIIESEKFTKFIRNIDQSIDSFKFACYWYFREPTLQAKEIEQAGVLVKKKLVKIDCHSNEEREQMYKLLDCNKKNNVMYRNKPMVHHFSWVRSKEEMLKKVKTWGHKDDKEWDELVKKEFSHKFRGTDFVHNYQYRKVKNIFNI